MSLKRSLPAFALVLLAAGSAGAAEARTQDWTGFYFGVNAGYGWGSSQTGTVLDASGAWAIEGPAFKAQFVGLSNQSISPSGFLGGLQAGYNWQAGVWVFGLEGDLNGSDMDGRTHFVGANPPTVRTFDESIGTDWFVTARPRIGRAFDATLVYITGGLVVGKVKGTWDLTSANGYAKTGRGSATNTGWTIGAGVEHGFSSMWTVKLEYLYTDLGNVSYTSVYSPGSTFAPPGSNYSEQITQDLKFHTIRLGLSRKFGAAK